MNAECGFYAVNGKHCVINGSCVVCKKPDEPQLEKGDTITLSNFGAADGTYKILDIKNGTMKLEFVK